ncbi:bifunctional biotin--[acetyl-CoA-carboxylase] ligase/biotin operon repressor BirA [Planctobacterium marinum]|uniref:Bifunctional ligase/repressor BirA n=1 Tax=Planctobacterium marinum TaxID=1631968 RepID=A0AA48HSL9_9ALTE|nr:bifunctional ligase/repressor BirA [Planctobacterium marinum]
MSKIEPGHLLNQLSTKHFVSGEELAQRFGVSRTAIAKQVKILQEYGVDIFSVQRSGYKLGREVTLIEKSQVIEGLANKQSSLLCVESLIDSTNDFVKERVSTLEDGFVCIAQGQKQGRGRQGKKWISPFASNLYLTMKWRFQLGFQSLSGLSLAIGVATVRTIKPLVKLPVTLKWPNDVYINGQKVSGTLVEVSGNPDGSCDAIIGIGLNVNMPQVEGIDQPWTDLQSNTSDAININRLTASFVNNLRTIVSEFATEGFSPFVSEWEAHDHFRDKEILVINGKNQTSCVSRGISSSGALVVEVMEDGITKTKELFGGEISVRSA